MTMRQETFRLVPTTLVNKTIPRPPMTSKAAKKAYREANKLPKISKSEQRRLEREEIARQKREYDKERAAAKAKAVREKKQLKEKEERERRRKEGVPEPNRYVRASQPTIKLFVQSGPGAKRAWEEADNGDNDDEDDGTLTKAHCTIGILDKAEEEKAADTPPEIIGIENNSWVLRSNPRNGLSAPVETENVVQKRTTPFDSSRPYTHTPSPKRSCYNHQRKETQPKERGGQALLDPESIGWEINVLEDTMKAQSSISKINLRPTKDVESPGAHLDVGTLQAGRQTRSVSSVCPKIAEKGAANAYARSCGRSREQMSMAMPPPPLLRPHVPVGNKRSRKPLGDISGNVASSPLRRWPKPAVSTSKITAHADKVGLGDYSAPPSSTQAFLEAHLDEFFPSPSQQVRELMNDIDDVPSNTQIAREIDATQSTETTQSQIPLVEAIDLSYFSSQDFVISSQDLREIDTPSRALPLDILSQRNATQPSPSCLAGPQKLSSATSDVIDKPTESQRLPRSVRQPKPRFFEEKEEDLLYAALHESFIMAKEKMQSSSPKRSQRTLQRVRSIKTDDGNDEYGFDDFDVDPEFLAALDQVEKSSFHSSFTCVTPV